VVEIGEQRRAHRMESADDADTLRDHLLCLLTIGAPDAWPHFRPPIYVVRGEDPLRRQPPRRIVSPRDIVAFAKSLEAAGFDGLWLSDLPVAPVPDPLLGLALAAGRSERLQLGAKRFPSAGTHSCWPRRWLSSISSPTAGCCSAPSPASAHQESARARARRRAPWRRARGGARLAPDLVGGRGHRPHSGRWAFDDLAPAARPVQDPLEVWLGGRGPKALDRVGRIADGWLGAPLIPAEAGPARLHIQEAARYAGREVSPCTSG
jgi:alkanesulfonate monooxygenase SsuD/methylene tetrahydromethanopterin reductase-like flavin-dependent oxidoreductase (luciferase family)